MVRIESMKLIESIQLTDDEHRGFTPVGPLPQVIKHRVGEIFLACEVHHRNYKEKVLTEITYQIESGGYGCQITPMLDFRNILLSDSASVKYDRGMTLMDLARVRLDEALSAISCFRLDKVEWTGEYPFRWSVAHETLGFKTSDELSPADMANVVKMYNSSPDMRRCRIDGPELFEIAKIYITPVK